MAKQNKTFTKVVLKRRRENLTKLPSRKPGEAAARRKRQQQEQKVQQPRDLALRNDYHEFYRVMLKKQMNGLNHMEVPFYVDREAKLAFVILIEERNQYLPRDMSKVLDTLRLQKRFDGVFVRLSEETYPLLRLADPMIAWGYVDEAHVRTLVMKHAYCVTRKSLVAASGVNDDATLQTKESIVIRREPLQSNQIVEDNLGEHDVICLEDIIEVLLNPEDERFPHVNAFLWPFKLNHPANRLPDVRKHYVHGGSRGNREEFINLLIDRLL